MPSVDGMLPESLFPHNRNNLHGSKENIVTPHHTHAATAALCYAMHEPKRCQIAKRRWNTAREFVRGHDQLP
jgi:hypothetical protein